MIRTFLLSLLALGSLVGLANACPFCSATAQTLRQDMAAMDVVAFGELVPVESAGKSSNTSSKPGDDIAGIAQFKIVQSLRGENLVPNGTVVSAPYYGPAKIDGRFLLMGVNQTEILWSSPLPVTASAETYLAAASQLGEDRSTRLRFYLGYLEHPEPLLARDAYEEFAQTPYEDVKTIRDSLVRTKLIEWIKSPDVAPDRKRLYYTLLGICADKSDAAFLESLLKSQDDSIRTGLDALVACYLTVVGESGLPLVEDLFLKNKKASYPDTFASVMALRFHGTEGGIIDRKKIVASMRWMLERPDFADLVIPDLARWEDWSQVDRLARLFREADDSSSWVRVPVVNYLRACPLPEAKTTLAELEKIDPKAVKRAATFFPIPQPAVPQPAVPQATPQTTPPSTGIDAPNDPAPAQSAPKGSSTGKKNETSFLHDDNAEHSDVAVMRLPLGARSPFAYRSKVDRLRFEARTRSRNGSGSLVASARGTETMVTLDSPEATSVGMNHEVFPDFILGEIPAVTGSKPMELCAAALLSSTTLLMFMWMILSATKASESSRFDRCWALVHRWAHGTKANR